MGREGLTLTYALAAVGFLIGVVFGSFLFAVAKRTVEGKSWWGMQRSCCDSCGKVLSPGELIPLASWLVQGGKCKSCKSPVSGAYPFWEVLTGVVTASVLAKWGLSWAGLLGILAIYVFLLHSMTDLLCGYIYDSITLVGAFLGFAVRVFGTQGSLLDGAMGALVGALPLALIILVSRGKMGWGDCFLMAGIGMILGGYMTAVALYFGSMVGGVVALYMLLSRRFGFKSALPFAPILAVGGFGAVIWGVNLLDFLYVVPPWPWFLP